MLLVSVFFNVQLHISKWWCSNHVGVLFCSAEAWAGFQSHLPVFPVRRDHRLSSHQEQTGSVACYQRATALHVTAHFTKVPSCTACHECLHLSCFVSVYIWIWVFHVNAVVYFMNYYMSKCSSHFWPTSHCFLFDSALCVSSWNTRFLVLTSPVNDHILKSHCHVRTSDHVFPEADAGLETFHQNQE